jgi:GH24 family phage-related lysozyme (muramidase)
MDPFAGSAFDPRTLHRYVYASGDPANKIDPSGEDFLTVGLAVGAIIATVATIASLSASIPFESPTYYGLPGPIPPATWFSNQGVEFVKSWEGFSATLYNDQAGHCTIGYGELVHYGPCNGTEPAEFRAGITEARATQLLRDQADLRFVPAVRQLVIVPLRQHQFDAIVSFVYNIGVNGFSRSGVLLALNTRRFVDAQNEILRWNRAGGVVSPGLANRRAAEVRLFRIGIYSRY